MKGLTPHTSAIIDSISKMECIKPFVLVGGTALSIQLNHRMSEDLDFMKWIDKPGEKQDVEWHVIKRELETISSIESMELYGFDMVEFVVEGVKLSFYCAPRKRIPSMVEIPVLNNIRVADMKSIGAMKMETLLRRAKFRDYYDIYSIVKNGTDINELISMALAHSGHRLKRKNLLSMLTNGELFSNDQDISHLSPVYDISAYEIQEYLKSLIG